MTLIDYCERITNAFPVFSYGEDCIDKIPFDRWDLYLYDYLWTGVFEFLKEFPELGPHEYERRIITDYQMSHIRQKITRAKSEFDCVCEIEQMLTTEPYRSMVQKLASERMTA